MQIYVGIDPGFKGGISAINELGQIVFSEVMPIIEGDKTELDLDGVIRLIKGAMLDNEIVMVAIEKVHALPRQSTSAMFRFGVGYGELIGIIHTLKLAYRLVRPQEWQKSVLKGFNQGDTKQASTLFCSRQWPGFDFRDTQRCKKLHDGMTDSTALAYYMLKNN